MGRRASIFLGSATGKASKRPCVALRNANEPEQSTAGFVSDALNLKSELFPHKGQRGGRATKLDRFFALPVPSGLHGGASRARISINPEHSLPAV